MLRIVAAVIALLVGSPAAAQMAPGGPAAVFDANGLWVGRYAGSFGTENAHHVLFEVDAELFLLAFSQNPQGLNGQWDTGSTGIGWQSTDCTGTPYLVPGAHSTGTPSGAGRAMFASVPADAARLYRSNISSRVLVPLLSVDGGGGCTPVNTTGLRYLGEDVGPLPYTFPFHLRPAGASAMALPPLAMLGGFVVLGASGLLALQRRR